MSDHEPPKVIYLCDQRACDPCSHMECHHTFDIRHAVNFKNNGANEFIEQERFEIRNPHLYKEILNNLLIGIDLSKSKDMSATKRILNQKFRKWKRGFIK